MVPFEHLFEVQIHEIYISMMHKIYSSEILLKQTVTANLYCVLLNKDSE